MCSCGCVECAKNIICTYPVCKFGFWYNFYHFNVDAYGAAFRKCIAFTRVLYPIHPARTQETSIKFYVLCVA
jgi:hypothetical protein